MEIFSQRNSIIVENKEALEAQMQNYAFLSKENELLK